VFWDGPPLWLCRRPSGSWKETALYEIGPVAPFPSGDRYRIQAVRPAVYLAAVAELRAFMKLSTLLLSIRVAPVSTNVGIGEKES
jgi:hypothetical protein